MKMIEKVAEAIFNKICPGIRYVENDKEFYKEVAIAALNSLREPDKVDPKILPMLHKYVINPNKGWDAAIDQIIDPD